jgi:tetratricopeptide (TPR) repeat protein
MGPVVMKSRRVIALAKSVGRREWPLVEVAALAILQEDPNDTLALEYLATAHEQLDDKTRAIEVRLHLHRLKPESFANLRALGRLLWNAGDVERGAEYLELAIRRGPQETPGLPWPLRGLLSLFGSLSGKQGLGDGSEVASRRSREADLAWVVATRQALDDFSRSRADKAAQS